jgi:membrane protein DedA with SNARE-associated domain
MAAQGLHTGAVVGPQTLYDLGREWYATRLDHDWQRPDAAQATRIFARHGLTGSFWSLV